MKVVTVLGTRPEIIRLSRVIPLLDKLCDHVLVHTGQNYDRNLNEIFFKELGLRVPDHVLECKSISAMEEISKIISSCEKVFAKEKPDRLLILGDTNSALSALVAKRMGIKVFHMEAGNRCFDDRVPEEVNRRIIDHCSDILMPYTERSRSNLLREGIAVRNTFVTGNPIKEILDYYGDKIQASNILERLNLASGKYFLVTLHRAENVDISSRLTNFIKALDALNEEYKIPVVCSLHPRTRSQLNKISLPLQNYGVRALDPLGLLDFVHLEKNAKCVLTDSGTVQEECCIFNIPNVTLRDVTERPETVEAGSNIISGGDQGSILNCVKAVLNLPSLWVAPTEYLKSNVSATATKIVLGYSF
jgi:UDP-N-acetylglucosamine 2-epimerase (non-hydrolysing)